MGQPHLPSAQPQYPYGSPQYAAPQPAGFEYAVWSTRVVGYLVDSILVGGAALILYLLFGTMLAGVGAALGGQEGEALAGGACCMMLLLFPLASLAVGIYNRVYLVASRGYSIGQGVMKIKVIDARGQKLTMGSAALRLLAQVGLNMIPLVGLLDLLWPLWDSTRQTLHDKAVGSYVVYNR
ncbi:MAG: RDD family protein [Bryobacteraceae bacterium]|nr:RDD family protein [Bryobacteraceae bacterium]